MILKVHILLLVIFVGVTSILMAVAVLDRLRTRPIRVLWHTNWRGLGFPGSVLLLAGIVGIVIFAGIVENDLYLYLAAGYLVGGMCWCGAVRLSSATIVTDYAIYRGMRNMEQMLGWHQVVDFFVHERENGVDYIFLYVDASGRHRRFELPVPLAYLAIFKQIVNHHVEQKTLPHPERAYG